MGQQEQQPIQQQYQLPQQYQQSMQQPMQQPMQQQPIPIQPVQPVGQQIPTQYQPMPQQPIQYQQQQKQQQSLVPQLQPMQFTQQPYGFTHYKLNGTLFSGFKNKFPFELTNVLAQQDFECIIDEVNKVVSYKQKLSRFLLISMFSSLVVFFLIIPSLVPFLIIFPIGLVVFIVSYIYLRKISVKRQDMLGKVVDNFNTTFLSRQISIEIKKKSYSQRYNFNSKLKICYPASLSVQPIVYYPQQTIVQQPIQPIQPIQQQQQPQQTYQQVVIEKPINETSSLLL